MIGIKLIGNTFERVTGGQHELSNLFSVCCFNRHYAEESGYFAKTNFLNEETGEKEITFYDSVSGKPLYIAPRGRTWKEFIIESKVWITYDSQR